MAEGGEAKVKKRSRTKVDSEEELEIDVNLPEPPSKKAKRLAKKAEKAGKLVKTVNDSTSVDDPTHPSRRTNVTTAEAAEKDAAPAKRSDYGVWIGNLEFSVSKENVRTFLCSKGPIDEAKVTRINMPAPPKQEGGRPGIKRLHKGFAYVDFVDEASMNKAIALSEEDFAGRKVLIKNAKSFAGRPDPKAAPADAGRGKPTRPPNKRVFVGNLAYDADVDELRQHFAQAGTVEDVSLMTWEDSGRCKGFGFVRFAELSSAETAVKGYIVTKGDEPAEDAADEVEKAEDGEAGVVKKAKKPRKWFINRLQGRQLDVQFAEDSSTRYKKRYGDSSQSGGEAAVAA